MRPRALTWSSLEKVIERKGMSFHHAPVSRLFSSTGRGFVAAVDDNGAGVGVDDDDDDISNNGAR